MNSKISERMELVSDFDKPDQCINVQNELFLEQIDEKQKSFVIIESFQDAYRYCIGRVAHLFSLSKSNKNSIVKTSVILDTESEIEIYRRNVELIISKLSSDEKKGVE